MEKKVFSLKLPNFNKYSVPIPPLLLWEYNIFITIQCTIFKTRFHRSGEIKLLCVIGLILHYESIKYFTKKESIF